VGLTALAVGVAAALDGVVGEPSGRVHPVAWFGRVVASLDREWRRPRLAGTVAAVVLPCVAAAFVGALVGVVAALWPVAGAVAAGLALFATSSLRRLVVVAGEVTAASETDLDRARERLRALVGRDASALSPARVRSAVVESLAENLADGLVAPLGAFAVGGAVGLRAPAVASSTLAVPTGPTVLALALASGGAAWVKAVNTMDSMLGYRSKPVGGAAARIDDAVMWVPARVTALLLAGVCLAPGATLAAREWLPAVPSPNSGWPMGTLAAALDVRLEKPGVYAVGSGALPTVADATRARRRVVAAGGLAYLFAGVVVWG
jgi:adenosylcobinamide-phosphate synthase